MSSSLRIEKVLPASPERVFDAFADPLQLGEWWGPHGYRSRVLELDGRPGGTLRLEVTPPDGEPFHIRGELLEVDRARVLAFTFRYEEPTPDDRENVVRVSFGDGARLVVEHGPFRTAERRALHETGWTEILERLEAFLGREPEAGLEPAASSLQETRSTN